MKKSGYRIHMKLDILEVVLVFFFLDNITKYYQLVGL